MTRTRPAAVTASEVALGAACLVGAAAIGRLVQGGWAGRATWPLVLTTLAGYAVTALGLRRRLSGAVVAAAGVVAVAWVAVVSSVPGAAWFGLPTGRTPHRVDLALRMARPAFDGWHWPVAASAGVALLATLVAGLAAVEARALAGPLDRWRPAAGLASPLLLVTLSAAAAPDRAAVWLAGALVVTGGATLLLVEGGADIGPVESRPGRGLAAGAGVVAVALLAVVLVGTAVAGNRPAGTSGSRAGSTGPAIAPTGLALASDLVGLEQRDPQVVLFRARIPSSTYWQLGVLTEWQDGQWVPDATTRAILAGSTAATVTAPPVPAPRGTFAAQVTMAALSSRLLPAPPRAVSVTPTGRAVVTSAGVVAPVAPRPGQHYGVTAAVAPSTADLSSDLDTGTATTAASPAELAQAKVIPSVPASVTALAQQVTGTATTPLGRAEALVNWFRSGAFHYTLDPPPAPAGTDPLVAFLTTTRAGTCESFASAFTVMARAVGLPTRIAIGFTGGTRGADGTTTVRGADAHAWPQVELGSAGWVSFEPTPQLPSGELSPPDVLGPTAVGPATTAAPTTTSPRVAPVTRPGSPVTSAAPTTSATAAPTTAAPPSTTARPLPADRRTDQGGDQGWWVAGAALGALLAGLVIAVGLVLRRRRAWARRRHAARDGVVGSWRHAADALAGTAWACPVSQSPLTYARHLQARTAQVTGNPGDGAVPSSAGGAASAQLRSATDELVRLAELTERSLFAARPMSAADIAWAAGASARVHATLSNPSVRALLAVGERRSTRDLLS